MKTYKRHNAKMSLIMHFVFTMWIFLVPKLYPISLLAARV